MKIAILQLARYGDILMTWPLIRALKRHNPGAHITMIVRETYQEALVGLAEIDACYFLPTQHLLGPVLENAGQEEVQESLVRIGQFMVGLQNAKFDWLINLSFSPLSAEISSVFESQIKVTGYSRFPDGALKLNGAASEYFYAQVGTHRPNRLHLLDIFSRLCHLQLMPSDFEMPQIQSAPPSESYITLHLAGSEEHKSMDVEMLTNFCQHFLEKYEKNIFLIGSSADQMKAEKIINSIPDNLKNRLQSTCGKTKIRDLFGLIKGAEFHFGGDSLPVQVSMFTGTPVVLLSFEGTNFWETGPLVQGSLILRYEKKQDVNISEVMELMDSWQTGKQIQDQKAYIATGFFSTLDSTKFAHLWPEWTWRDVCQDLLNEIYFNQSNRLYQQILGFEVFQQGFEQLRQANEIVLSFLNKQNMTSEQKNFLRHASAQVDQIFEQIGRLHPVLSATVRWSQALKSQVQGGTFEQIRQDSLKVYSHIQKNLDKLKLNEAFFSARLAADFQKEKEL